ncbi:unnamed protein product, partial [Medioppia subpectinata]
MESLINWCDSKNKDKRSPNKPGNELSTEVLGKRSKHSDEKPSKKFKDNHPNSSNSGKSRPQKAKNIPSIKNTETNYSEPQQKAVSKANAIQIKNDIPNQFWHFIEPYSCEITSEHIKFLNEELKSYETDCEFYKIPNLGKHY